MLKTEKPLNVSLSDGKRAYGRIREVEGAPVVVMAHGGTCRINDHPYEYASRRISNAGFSVYRFAFYDYAQDARTTTDLSIEDHISDIDSVVRYFVERGNSVSVIGHSIGGLAALASRERRFDSLVLWDASHPAQLDPRNWPDLWKWEPALDCWRFENGIVSLFDKRFVESFMALDADTAAATMDKPVKYIGASESVNANVARDYFALTRNEAKSLHVIEGADHGFTSEAHADELVDETLQWLRLHGLS